MTVMAECVQPSSEWTVLISNSQRSEWCSRFPRRRTGVRRSGDRLTVRGTYSHLEGRLPRTCTETREYFAAAIIITRASVTVAAIAPPSRNKAESHTWPRIMLCHIAEPTICDTPIIMSRMANWKPYHYWVHLHLNSCHHYLNHLFQLYTDIRFFHICDLRV